MRGSSLSSAPLERDRTAAVVRHREAPATAAFVFRVPAPARGGHDPQPRGSGRGAARRRRSGAPPDEALGVAVADGAAVGRRGQGREDRGIRRALRARRGRPPRRPRRPVADRGATARRTPPPSRRRPVGVVRGVLAARFGGLRRRHGVGIDYEGTRPHQRALAWLSAIRYPARAARVVAPCRGPDRYHSRYTRRGPPRGRSVRAPGSIAPAPGHLRVSVGWPRGSPTGHRPRGPEALRIEARDHGGRLDNSRGMPRLSPATARGSSPGPRQQPASATACPGTRRSGRPRRRPPSFPDRVPVASRQLRTRREAARQRRARSAGGVRSVPTSRAPSSSSTAPAAPHQRLARRVVPGAGAKRTVTPEPSPAAEREAMAMLGTHEAGGLRAAQVPLDVAVPVAETRPRRRGRGCGAARGRPAPRSAAAAAKPSAHATGRRRRRICEGEHHTEDRASALDAATRLRCRGGQQVVPGASFGSTPTGLAGLARRPARLLPRYPQRGKARCRRRRITRSASCRPRLVPASPAAVGEWKSRAAAPPLHGLPPRPPPTRLELDQRRTGRAPRTPPALVAPW